MVSSYQVARKLGLGGLKDLRRRTALHNAATIQNANTIAQMPKRSQIMRDIEDRRAKFAVAPFSIALTARAAPSDPMRS